LNSRTVNITPEKSLDGIFLLEDFMLVLEISHFFFSIVVVGFAKRCQELTGMYLEGEE
jgi:hypothetical protein